MKEFLNQVWLDNTVQDYLISLLIVLVFLAIRRLVSRYTAMLVARFFTKVEKGQKAHQQRFNTLVLQPVERFLTIAVVLFALDKLNYPELLQIKLYKASLKQVLEGIGIAALIISFIWLINRMIQYAADLLKERAGETSNRSDDQLVVFFRDFLKVITWILGLLLILRFVFGYNISNLLTGLSIVGAALALAFRESLENLIASFIIFFDKPFTTGDLVKVEHVTGFVEYIGLRSTRIRTTDKTYTTVPNKKMVDTIIDNQSLRTERNVQIKMHLDIDAGTSAIKQFVASVDELLEGREHVNDHHVFLADTGYESNLVQVDYFVSMELSIKEFFALRQEINLALLELKASYGLPSAFPSEPGKRSK